MCVCVCSHVRVHALIRHMTSFADTSPPSSPLRSDERRLNDSTDNDGRRPETPPELNSLALVMVVVTSVLMTFSCTRSMNDWRSAFGSLHRKSHSARSRR